MEEFILHQIQDWPLPLLFVLIAVSILVLGKAADWLVKEAVALSERSGVPKIVIGATIVSLGTTMPEAAVSVLAALQGNPNLALGNAVGSIICDTGLILGLACLIAPLQLPPNIVNRQGWIQLGAAVLLVLCCIPFRSPGDIFTVGGRLDQWQGFVMLGLLALYLWVSAYWARTEKPDGLLEDLEGDVSAPLPWIVGKLLLSIALVILASNVLIPTVNVTAVRLHIPEEVIAASLVAFGTSTPELVTAIVAARHGHGDLAVGNIVGADILNVLFVAGAAAAVSPGGLHATPYFFTMLFPAMLFVLVVFRLGVFFSGDRLRYPFGVVLLVAYIAVTAMSFLVSEMEHFVE